MCVLTNLGVQLTCKCKPSVNHGLHESGELFFDMRSCVMTQQMSFDQFSKYIYEYPILHGYPKKDSGKNSSREILGKTG